MSTIRPLVEDDISPVVSLYEHVMRSGSRDVPPGLEAYFAQMFLNGPYVDPEIPSLVYEEGGRIGGFIGSTVRRLIFSGQPVRLACTGPLFTEPSLRGPGAFLMRRYLAGPQEVSISDRQNLIAQRLFTRLGGIVAPLHCLRWTCVFRPFTFKGQHLLRLQSAKRLEFVVHPAGHALDVLSRPLTRVRPVPSRLRGEKLTPKSLWENLPVVTRTLQLYPDYQEAFLTWLFAELEKMKSRGALQAVLVRDGAKQDGVVGWYLYHLKPDGLSQVLQVAAQEGAGGDVLDHLIEHARRGGAAALRGRLEPHLREPLRGRRCTFHQEACLLVHSKHPEILGAINAGRALLSELEGELWVGVLRDLFPYTPAAKPNSASVS